MTQKTILLAFMAALGVSAAGAASQWVTVANLNDSRVEFDKSRITHKAGGFTTVWSRIALQRDFIDEQGMRYTAIEALTRYDCERRRFATVRRVYRRDSQTVRDEAVADVRELAVEPDSVDDKLMNAVCLPQSLAAAAPAEANGKPGPMYADMRSADTGPKTRTLQVADAAPAAKAAEKPAEKPADKAAKPGEKAPEAKPADAKAAEAPPAGRPRFIDLPKIDKSQFDDGKSAAKPADAKAAAPAKSDKADKPAADKSPVARQDLERMYATSGPRKAAKARPAEAPANENRSVHWSYDGDGAPANWDKLRSEYAVCGTGKRQSPIDIRDTIKVDLEPIQFDYKPTQFRITDNGHTVQVDVGEGSSMRVMERQFQLVQFHFHRPSEERINGKSYDMVAHLVHRDDDGKLAVIAVLMEKGSEHPLIQTLWNNMPLERGQSITPSVTIDLNALLPPPERRAYFTYMGSLTTPPCTEDVLWMVMRDPVAISAQQLSIFSRVYSHNARPVQPANGRLIKETR